MKRLNSVFLTLALLLSLNVSGAEHYLRGDLKNITSNKNGLLIQLDTGVPDNCEGTPYNWMVIKKDYTTMISVVLMAWSTDRKNMTVYTDGKDATGYCIINQVDPDN